MGGSLVLPDIFFLEMDDFQWDATLNFARNKTVIDKLGNGGRDYINGNYAFVEGRPAFQYYTYEYLGRFTGHG